MKTIIQKLPTIYGEVTNGSVYGQPNGSIARPPQNVPVSITLSGTPTLTFDEVILVTSAKYTLAGLTISHSGELPQKTITTVYASDDTIIAEIAVGIGNGSYPSGSFTIAGELSAKPSNGDTVKIVIVAYDAFSNVIATSNTLTGTAVVE